MARKPDELKQYVEDLAKEKGLTDTQTKIGIAFMLDDKEALKDVSIDDLRAAVVPIADLAVGRRADHSRAMNEAQQAHLRAVKDYNDNQTWRTTAKAEFDKALADRDALKLKVGRYEHEFGSIDETVDIGGGKTVTATGDVVRTADIDKLRKEVKAEAKQEMAAEVFNYEIERSRIAKEHWNRFKEPLDTEELLSIVGKYVNDPLNPRQISLSEAHTELYGEKITKLDSDARAAELKAAEDRGIAKGRTAAVAALGRSGAAVPETGMVFERINTERKAGDKPVIDPNSDDDLAAAFAQDLDQYSRSTTDDSAAAT